jgi:hypothetical protein
VQEKMDEKGKRIQAQIQFMERNVKALEELVTKMVRIREAQEAFYVQFSKGMQDIGAQEDFSPLSQCFGVMADSCKKLNTETHEIMIQRPEEGIMQMLTQIQDWGITPMKVSSTNMLDSNRVTHLIFVLIALTRRS